VEFMNVADAMSRLNNNKKLYTMLLKKFDCDAMIDALLTQIESRDTDAAKASAHTIKGLAANLSLADLRAKAEALEARLKAGETDIDTAEIEDSAKGTIEAIAEYIAANA